MTAASDFFKVPITERFADLNGIISLAGEDGVHTPDDFKNWLHDVFEVMVGAVGPMSTGDPLKDLVFFLRASHAARKEKRFFGG
jgi:hypothetical protein